MKKIEVMIIDDERASREELKKALSHYNDFVLIGEAENADDAKALIEIKQPDLIFLDIQMPEKSGFDLLASLNSVPYVVFVTAYNEYAVQAFEVNALDYLVKPFRHERFEKAISKIKTTIHTKTLQNDSIASDRKIFIKDGEHCFFIPVNDIYLIESLENYTRLYFQNKKALQRRSLNQWEELLDSEVFFRINRTELVNIFYIEAVDKKDSSKLKIKLKTGEVLELSSRQSTKFKQLNRIS
jgi:two-component system, LytTR family, response regulator